MIRTHTSTPIWWIASLLLCLIAPPTYAQQEQRSAGKGASVPLPITGTVIDVDHNALDTALATTLAGEDVINDVQKVESRWSVLPTGATTSMFAADTAIKNAPGLVHAITCFSDATATAGTIALLDNTAAGAGNTLWSFDVLAVAYNTPFRVELDTPFAVGLYADFTTTADVKCMVQYR